MISAPEKYGAFRAKSPNPLQRFDTCFKLIAANVPETTIVSASPILKHSTSVAPSAILGHGQGKREFLS